MLLIASDGARRKGIAVTGESNVERRVMVARVVESVESMGAGV